MSDTWPKTKDDGLDENLLLIRPSTEEQLEADWKMLRGPGDEIPDGPLPRMSREDLKAFIQGVVQNTIFTSDHIRTRREWTCACESLPSIRQDKLATQFEVCPICEYARSPIDTPDMDMGMVFLPIGLGGLADFPKDRLEEIGCFWEYYHEALPRGINGYPMFASVKLMHALDWTKAHKIIRRETTRLNNIEVGDDEK